MKKLLILVAVLLLSTQVQAAQVSIAPSVGFYNPNSFEEGVQVGVGVDAQNVFSDAQVVLSSGLKYFATEYQGTDVDFYTIPFSVGYNIPVDANISVLPYGGVDVVLADSDVPVDNTYGVHVGAKLNFNEPFGVSGLDAFTGVEFQWARLNVGASDTELTGPTFLGGVTWNF